MGGGGGTRKFATIFLFAPFFRAAEGGGRRDDDEEGGANKITVDQSAREEARGGGGGRGVIWRRLLERGKIAQSTKKAISPTPLPGDSYPTHKPCILNESDSLDVFRKSEETP